MKYYILFVLVIFAVSCSVQKNRIIKAVGPPAIVYKTKKDYFNLVPVILSADKQNIVSYPDPKDLLIDNKLCLPDRLENGYLLDNRGINLNAGFLNISYQDYSKLSTPPSLTELNKLLLDSDPLIELYDLGLRYNFRNIEEEINQIIIRNQLPNFKRLK